MKEIKKIKLISKELFMTPRWNKANNQINLQLKKKTLPKELRDKLPQLKSIKLNLDDFKFE